MTGMLIPEDGYKLRILFYKFDLLKGFGNGVMSEPSLNGIDSIDIIVLTLDPTSTLMFDCVATVASR